MTNTMTLEQVKHAMRSVASEHDFVWDGVDQDDRPATPDELKAALEASRRRAGRPAGSVAQVRKQPITLRVSPDALTRWRASGKGWQTRAAAVLAAHAPL
jgi:uncharacterized protein (DUF4415 family)